VDLIDYSAAVIHCFADVTSISTTVGVVYVFHCVLILLHHFYICILL